MSSQSQHAASDYQARAGARVPRPTDTPPVMDRRLPYMHQPLSRQERGSGNNFRKNNYGNGWQRSSARGGGGDWSRGGWARGAGGRSRGGGRGRNNFRGMLDRKEADQLYVPHGYRNSTPWTPEGKERGVDYSSRQNDVDDNPSGDRVGDRRGGGSSERGGRGASSRKPSISSSSSSSLESGEHRIVPQLVPGPGGRGRGRGRWSRGTYGGQQDQQYRSRNDHVNNDIQSARPYDGRDNGYNGRPRSRDPPEAAAGSERQASSHASAAEKRLAPEPSSSPTEGRSTVRRREGSLEHDGVEGRFKRHRVKNEEERNRDEGNDGGMLGRRGADAESGGGAVSGNDVGIDVVLSINERQRSKGRREDGGEDGCVVQVETSNAGNNDALPWDREKKFKELRALENFEVAATEEAKAIEKEQKELDRRKLKNDALQDSLKQQINSAKDLITFHDDLERRTAITTSREAGDGDGSNINESASGGFSTTATTERRQSSATETTGGAMQTGDGEMLMPENTATPISSMPPTSRSKNPSAAGSSSSPPAALAAAATRAPSLKRPSSSSLSSTMTPVAVHGWSNRRNSSLSAPGPASSSVGTSVSDDFPARLPAATSTTLRRMGPPPSPSPPPPPPLPLPPTLARASSNSSSSGRPPAPAPVRSGGPKTLGITVAEPRMPNVELDRRLSGVVGSATRIGCPFSFRQALICPTRRDLKARVLAFNPVEKDLFAVCSDDQSVDLWRHFRGPKHELKRLKARLERATPKSAAHMAWNPSGTHLAIGYTGATMEENWAATIVARDGFGEGTRRRLRCLKHTKPAGAVAWVTPSTNSQNHLVTGGEDHNVVIWTRVLDVESDLHKVAILHKQHTAAVRSACCPSISPTVVTGGADGRLVCHSLESGLVQWEHLLRIPKEYHPTVNEVLEFPNNPFCLLVSAVATAKSHTMFTMDTRQDRAQMYSSTKMELEGTHDKPFNSFLYPRLSPCGRYVACAGDRNRCFYLWDVRADRVEPMQRVSMPEHAPGRVWHTAWHPDKGSGALISLLAGHGAATKNFVLHLI